MHAVLDVGAADRGGTFGSECQGFATEVVKGVHLFLDDVGFVAHAASKQTGMLEDGGVDLLVPELERGTNRSCFDSVPEGLVVRKDVGDTAWHPVVSLFSHFSPILCSPIVRTLDCWAGYGALIDFRIRNRGMAQSGSALDWGSRGHRFKSCCPDHSFWPVGQGIRLSQR